MRLNGNDFRSKPALRVEDFGDASAAVLTISDVSVGQVTESDGKRQVVRVHTREFPDKVFYVNPAGVTACIERFGEDTNHWAGNDLPVVVRRTLNPVTKQTVYALHVAPLADWEGIIDGSGVVDSDDDDDATVSTPAAEPAPAPRFRGTRKSASKTASKSTRKNARNG